MILPGPKQTNSSDPATPVHDAQRAPELTSAPRACKGISSLPPRRTSVAAGGGGRARHAAKLQLTAASTTAVPAGRWLAAVSAFPERSRSPPGSFRHPDKLQLQGDDDPRATEEAREMFHRIQEAYEGTRVSLRLCVRSSMDAYADRVSIHAAVLSDASRRAAYDAELSPPHPDPMNYFPSSSGICMRMARGVASYDAATKLKRDY
ncbi:hypothetical protein C2845_PM10G18800 [Panicum miliaceum]|uniref:J domain-containing protein n=1 Tax=Panicum miliaceum TaxID=4540 RepID=A0A3L6PA66_PANMI|nr:hypothetical protein C2845_PM10G18800 [Panicum miliaceum]